MGRAPKRSLYVLLRWRKRRVPTGNLSYHSSSTRGRLVKESSSTQWKSSVAKIYNNHYEESKNMKTVHKKLSEEAEF